MTRDDSEWVNGLFAASAADRTPAGLFAASAADRTPAPANRSSRSVFGLKVGIVGTVKFEARIRELVENLPNPSPSGRCLG
jgi:hypothetical protein